MDTDDLDERAIRQESWGFDPCCEKAFGAVCEAWESRVQKRPAGQKDDLWAVASALSHGLVAPAFAEHVIVEYDDDDLLASFAAELSGVAGTLGAPGLYLCACLAEFEGEAAEGEAALRAATVADPNYAPALVDLAWFAADRGDAATAVSLLRRAGVDDDEPKLAILLSRLSPRAQVGRNDPCPCGSGRKYKACCLDNFRPPIEERVGWLCQKLVTFTLRPPRRDVVQELVAIVEEFAGPRVAEGLVPVMIELAAFQGGALEEFIEERGDLLPPDELVLCRTWLGSLQALWEVVGTEPGFTVTLRDTRTGDSVVATERSASQTLRPGDYLLTRVVPAGSQNQIVGVPLSITLRQRDSLIQLLDGDPEVEEIAEWLGVAMGPPVLTNREGEDLFACRAVLQPVSASWDEVASSLDANFNSTPDESLQGWTESVTIDGEDLIRCFLRREGDALSVQTNSIERFMRVMGALQGLVAGGFEVLEEEVLSPEEMSARDLEGGGVEMHDDDLTELSPEVTKMMEDLMRQKEDAWLEEQVPALGGVTPRQAAADPTRREDLIALLRDFDRPQPSSGPMFFSFDVTRLRQKLGLPAESR